MKILVESEMHQAICTCKPTKVAVAYIGSDWNKFIPDAGCLEAIIVSPTFGSNPRAIADLVRQIGWDKVFYLDELHAKTYVGNKSAVIGSANLTHNGLSGEVLFELCVEFNDEENLEKIGRTFDDLMQRAQNQYPTTESKQARLIELERIWGAAIPIEIVQNNNGNRSSFEDFELLGKDHFYVVWYQAVDCEYSEEVKAVQSLIQDDLHFSSSNEVEKNKWVLIWRLTNEYKPDMRKNPYWLYIHDFFENGVIDEGYEYTKVAIQWKHLNTPPSPFELTNKVSEAFKKAIQEDDIARHLIQEEKIVLGNVFSLASSQEGVPLLMSRMKEKLVRTGQVQSIL